MPRAAQLPETVTTFGAFLKYLRCRARLTQRELGVAVNYSEAQISRLEQNNRLPDLTALVALFVPALGLQDDPALVTKLLEWAALARGEFSELNQVASATKPRRQVSTDRDHTRNSVRGHQAKSLLPGNLPVPQTSMIGRIQEMEDVCDRLLRPDVRLLTLTGPPGVGKTRLAIQAALKLHNRHDAHKRWADGLWFVSLASISDPSLVIHAIAQALGITDTTDAPVVEQLKTLLQTKHLLLLLDNFEHLVKAAPFIAELLTAAPTLKLLVTSRIVLHLSSEHEFPVAPLALPHLAHLPTPDRLVHNPAVSLFVTRAQAVHPSFVLTAANAVAVAAICVRLDGLPLAIELAAARTKLLDPQTLLTRLHPRLPLLARVAHDIPARHQTLKSAIAWSYDMLPTSVKTLFVRLSVFVNGCQVDAVEAICEDAHLEISVLDALELLADSSLLQTRDEGDGRESLRRIFMLETIREFASQHFLACADEQTIRRRHADHFTLLAEQAEPMLTRSDQQAWLVRLEAEYANIRAALDWSLAQHELALAQRLAGALWRFWYMHGGLAEGRGWLSKVIALSNSTHDSSHLLQAKVLYAASALAWADGDSAVAQDLAERCLAMQRALGNHAGIAQILNVLGNLATDRGLHQQAVAYLEEGLALQREARASVEIATLLHNLGTVARYQGDYPRAAASYAECLEIYREQGDQSHIAITLGNLGDVLLIQGHYERAMHVLEDSLRNFGEFSHAYGVGNALSNLAEAVRNLGDYTRAQLLAERSLSVHQKTQSKDGIAVSLLVLGEIALELGNIDKAQSLLEESLAQARDISAGEWIVIALIRLGQLACQRHRLAQAENYLQEALNASKANILLLRTAQALEGLAMIAVAQGRDLDAASLLGDAKMIRVRIGAPQTPLEDKMTSTPLGQRRNYPKS